jgi:hypothetical protein
LIILARALAIAIWIATAIRMATAIRIATAIRGAIVTLAPRVTGARVAFTDKESTKHVVRWSVAGDIPENYFLAFA